jgi:hypothetical protein
MPTTERERYRQALAEVARAEQAARRSEMLIQIELNRLREAEVEGFEDVAAQHEARQEELARQFDAERAEVARLAGRAETRRISAVGEEIDEVVVDYDAALGRAIAAAQRLAAAIETAAALAERADRLAATLPADAAPPRRAARAAVEQMRALNRQLDRLLTAATASDLPPRPPAAPPGQA